MFVTTSNSGYTRGGEQFSHGRFLVLMADDDRDADRTKVRGLVRFVRMRQMGHFMMARLVVAGVELSLSGAYGADGLILTVPSKVYAVGYDLPPDLYTAWANGGGWNGAGSEARKLREWALTLPKGGRPRRTTQAVATGVGLD